MKTIGLIGGLSWESSQIYYQILNRKINEKLGGLNSCKCILYSVNFAEIADAQKNGEWDKVEKEILMVAKKLELAGADMILICANTIHKFYDAIQANIKIPILHIVDATYEEIKKKSFNKLGLIATLYSMEQDFLIKRYKEKFNINIIVPEKEDRLLIQSIIYNELTKGIFLETSKKKIINIMEKLMKAEVEGIILGCTEIELLISQKDVNFQVYETARLHAERAVEQCLMIND